MKQYIKRTTNLFCFFVLLFSLTRCKKLAEVSPPSNRLTGSSVFTNDATAASVLTGIYTNMSSGIATGINGISVQAGLSADELTLWSGSTNLNFRAQYSNSLSSLTYPPYWGNFYSYLFTINSAVDGITNATTLTPAVKQQSLGEAKFLRAFINFYLVNLYGAIPLVTTIDYKINASLSRTSPDLVYNQIIADLHDAQHFLSTEYLDNSLIKPTIERVRPTKWAATALLARVYLYDKNWAGADSAASVVLSNSSKFSLVPLNNVFLKNSNETIWQLQPVNTGWNTEEARVFVLPAGGPNANLNPVYLSDYLVNAFDSGDQRKSSWVNSVTVTNASGNAIYYFPYKYKATTISAVNNVYPPATEYTMVLRLAEQYLIRAEARAQLNKIAEGQSDLNAIRTRAGLPNTTATDQQSLLSALLKERRVELFTEWGQRWLDLKRTGTIDAVMSVVTPIKGGAWNTNWQWYPVPLTDLIRDPNLTQNPGY